MRSSSLCRASLRGPEVGRGLLAAAPVGLNVVGDLLTLSGAAHPTRIRGPRCRGWGKAYGHASAMIRLSLAVRKQLVNGGALVRDKNPWCSRAGWISGPW